MIPIQHIHPMIVHFPIVLIFLLAAFDIVASVRGHAVTGHITPGNISTSLAVFTAITAVAAYVFGGLALGVAEAGGFHSEVAEIHESMGETVAILTSVYALLRVSLWYFKVQIPMGFRTVFPVLGICGSVLVTLTAYYGGQLVYELGVNVQHLALN